MTERLDEAKKYLKLTYTDSDYGIALCEHIGIPRELLEYLIQQAELANLLVTDKSRVQLEKRAEELEEALLQTKYDRCLYIASVEKRERYKQALEKIATRKMSQYLTVRDMTNDFIKIANEALEELK